MPELNLGHVRAVPDYTQNDPNGAGYIKNRPCYFTGNMIEELYASIPGTDDGAFVSSLMTAGDKYKFTINNISVELDAYNNSYSGTDFVQIGDNFADFLATGDDASFDATYGYAFASIAQDTNIVGMIRVTDETLMKSSFGLTDDDFTNGNFTITVHHLIPEAVKLDKRFLPDDIGGGSQIKIMDIGASDDVSSIDFSSYKPGDVILVVGDANA